jgi:hypothetical protein
VSNHLAIATVTATLRELLKSAVTADVAGADVSMVRPDGAATGTPPTGVNIFLYQVTPSAAARNEDLPTRAGDGHMLNRPRVGLDLHYLFTFYGQETDLEPQRVLGSVVRTLHARPVLTRKQVTNAITGFPFLSASNLADDVELVKFTPLPLSLEELSKLWSVFFQTTYRLSVAYQGTVVLIESDDAFASPLPVRLRNLYVETFSDPYVERVVAASGDDDPIVAGAGVRVLGKNLLGDFTELVIGGQPPVAPLPGGTDTELQVALPAALKAGLQGLQVQRPRAMGTPPVDHPGVESNVAPFVLTPRIAQVGGVYQVSVAGSVTEPDGTRSADVTVQVEPQVGARQRVALLLNETAATGSAAFTFPDDARSADTGSLTVHVAGAKPPPAQYLLRVRVDGADSPLELAGGTYSDPKVTL